MAYSSSPALLSSAAVLLSNNWYTCRKLGEALYNVKPKTKNERMSIMVRARRPINRLKRMGVLAVRPDATGVAEYTLLPEGTEIVKCLNSTNRLRDQ